jgi:cell wall-associated NlpC family hydrolase
MGQRWTRAAQLRRTALAVLISACVAVPLVSGIPWAGATPPQPTATQTTNDFWLATASGNLYNFGVFDFGSPGGSHLSKPIVGMTATRSRQGYWLVASDGGIFSYGDAHFYGSTGAIALNKPIVGMSPTLDQHGYWLVASDGGIFSYGDAHFYGSTGAIALNKPIVGMAHTPDGKGYWLVASDGGVFSFGDASFYGSTGAITLDQPIVGMSTTRDGKGYWLVAADGGVFAFGDARFYGSTAGAPSDPVERLVPTHSGQGYWIVQQNGSATAFGDAVSQTLPPEALLFKPATPGDRAVLFAFQQLGKPYVWGGNGPVGYDCSGLVLASWEHADGIGFARVANDQYETAGTPVAMNDLVAGDLVFWGDNANVWSSVYHTAMYVGGNRIVESTGNHVQLNVLNQWGTDQLMPHGRRP